MTHEQRNFPDLTHTPESLIKIPSLVQCIRSPPKVIKQCSEPRSYLVRVRSGQCVRKNRRHLKEIIPMQHILTLPTTRTTISSFDYDLQPCMPLSATFETQHSERGHKRSSNTANPYVDTVSGLGLATTTKDDHPDDTSRYG
ncbi:hypothetical protein PoB_000850700 [Plakobranchus ocellatus]|uniref:Uncharacterized protein n=1 Tax=Plakobranchus ocellatus TaxID=259542 RepID=A0AAV3YHV6_9GAST|nr:hypothetical protein PoB_000850700 [Plakobranchus ocellatus]